jgi:hypothetical protein
MTAPLVPVLRRLLYVAAALVFLAGVQLFVFPLRTERYFAWTIDSPMTAVFLGASYWAAIGLELGAARATHWSRARIAVPAVFVFTTLTLVITFLHFHRLHFGSETHAPHAGMANPAIHTHAMPFGTRAVAAAWIAIYTVVPLLLVWGWLAQRRASMAVPPAAGLPTLVRGVLLGMGAFLLVVGTTLFFAPQWSDSLWPWALTPLTSGAVGAWLVGLGVAALHAWLIDDRASLRPLGYTGVLFGILQGIALARFGDELDWQRPAAIVYVTVLVVLTAVSAWALLDRRRSDEPVREQRDGSIDVRRHDRAQPASVGR